MQDILLLETRWRITNKINSPAFNRDKLLYLLVEELSLMFEALVVRISTNSNRGDEIPEPFFQGSDMNITEDDYKQIAAAFPFGLAKRCLAENRVVTDRLQTEIGRGNNTVRFIDSVLLLPIRLPDASEPAGMVEIYYSCGKHDVPDRSGLAEHLLCEVAQDGASAFMESLREALTEAIRTARYSVSTASTGPEKVVPPSGSVRKSKLDFLKKCTPAGEEPALDKVVLDYKNYFKPIDAVLERLRRTFPGLPSFYFSYRRPEDDHLSFFLTATQVGDLLLRQGVSLDDFKHLWTYPYQKSGLNGYVLKTRHAIYMPNHHTDAGYIDFGSEDSRTDSDIQYKGDRQRSLLSKLFNLEGLSRHTYIVPIFFAAGSAGGVFVSMGCTTDTLEHLARSVRKRMFDLAWESATAMELSLIAQDTTEEAGKLQLEVAEAKVTAKDLEVKVEKAALKAKEADRRVSLSGWLGHTLPKFIFKPLEFYIQKMYTDLRDPEKLREDYNALSFFNSKGQTEFKWFLEFNIAGTPDPVGVPSGRCSVGDVMRDVEEIHAKSRDLAVAGRFDRWDVRKGDGRKLREVAQSSIDLDVKTLRDSRIAIMGSRESHVIALWNMIDNALDSFEWNVLNVAEDARLSIKIDGSTVDQRFRLRISNNGKEMKADVARLLRALLNAARSDDPDVVRFMEGQRSADEVMEELKKILNKENPCQGLYRTARFLHDLSPEHPGYIEFDRKAEWTVFDLYIPTSP